MSHSGKLLLVLAAIIALGFQSGKATSSRQKINEYLVDHVLNDNVDENLDRARSWLNHKLEKKSFFSQSSLVRDLQTFTSLARVRGDEICNKDSYEILQANSELLKLDLTNPAPIRRIEKILSQVSEQHATSCLNTYAPRYRKVIETMDPEYLKRAEAFTNEMSENVILGFLRGSNLQLSEQACRKHITESKYSTYRALTNLAKNDPEAKFLVALGDEKSGKIEVNKEKLKGLMKKYLVDSCRYYYDKLADVFLPAQYDAKVKFERRKEDFDFYKGWTRFRLCGCLANHELDHQLFSDIVKLAS